MAEAIHPTFYRAIWRWHFFAGLAVLPVLAWMAATGGAYLYHQEIERSVYGGWYRASDAPALPVSALIAATERQTGGNVVQVAVPAASGESWRVALHMPDGEARTAFVDPGTGAVRGSVAGGGIAETIKHLHSLTIAGTAGNVLVEIVAGWAIVLALSGFYLWWPRGGERALSLAGQVGGRRFFRNLHASTGAVIGLALLFLALTGMPWSIFWGERSQDFIAAQEIGRPQPQRADSATHHDNHDAALPWSLRGRTPELRRAVADIGPDRALAIALARGVAAPFTLGLPREAGKAYLVSHAAKRQQDAHVVYVDPADGRVLLDARGSDFGIGARVVEWGIYTHQGEQYGEANRLVMLAACLGTLLLAFTAPVLWWKRRRPGRLDAPPRADPARMRGVAIVILAVGALFPLTGLTMIAALASGRIFRQGDALQVRNKSGMM